MIAVDAFDPGDLTLLEAQPEQAAGDVSRETGLAMQAAGPCFTARLDGRVVLVAGFTVNAAYHATAWCRLALGKGAALVALTRATRRVIEAAHGDYRRIDMLVRTGFGPGARWAAALGFTWEGTMRSIGPEGQDFDMWARLSSDGLPSDG